MATKKSWNYGDTFTISNASTIHTLCKGSNGKVGVNTSGRTLDSFYTEEEVTKYFENRAWKLARHNPFKVGDKVIFQASKTSSSFYDRAKHFTHEAKLVDGETYEVSSIGTNGLGGYHYLHLKGFGYQHPYDCFDFAPTATPPKFKVGDKVTYNSKVESFWSNTHSWAKHANLVEGEVYIVSETQPYTSSEGNTPGQYSIRLKDKSYWFAEDCFDFAKEAPMFKVGDRVKYVKDANSFWIHSAEWEEKDGLVDGAEYGVTNISEYTGNGISGKYTIKLNGKMFWVAEDRFVKAEPKRIVYCVDNETDYGGELSITIGKGYEVLEVKGMYLEVINDKGDLGVYSKSRFSDTKPESKAVQPPFKAGDCLELVDVEDTKKRMMLCVDMSDSGAAFTVGKTYELYLEDKKYYHFLKDDNGRDGGGMWKHRFVEVKDTVDDKPQPKPTDLFNIGDKFTVHTDIVYTIENHHRGNKDMVTVTWNNGSPASLNYDKDSVNQYFEKGEWKKVTKTKEMMYCIKNDRVNDRLTLNKQYEILEKLEQSQLVKVIDDTGKKQYFNMDRFTSEPNKKKVLCIDNSHSTTLLTVGKEYEVIEETVTMFTVMSDKGSARMFNKDRFASEIKKTMYCIDSAHTRNLTFNKAYEILSETGYIYRLINDKGELEGFLKSRFSDKQGTINTNIIPLEDFGDYKAGIVVKGGGTLIPKGKYVVYNLTGEPDSAKIATWKIGDRFQVGGVGTIFTIVLEEKQLRVKWWSTLYDRVESVNYLNSDIDRLVNDGTWTLYEGKTVTCVDVVGETHRLVKGMLYEIADSDSHGFVKVRNLKTGDLIDYWYGKGRFI